MAKVKIRYWKDIPVSVHVSSDNDRANLPLPKIYMVTVDAVATKTGLTDSSAYLAGFRTATCEREGAAQAVAETVADGLRERYPAGWLREQRRNAGVDPATESQIDAEARE